MTDYENYADYSKVWPFENINNINGRLVANHPNELGETLFQMSGQELEGNKFIYFAECRKTFFETAVNIQDRSTTPQIFETLANDLYELVIFVQKKRTSSADWGETSLKMLFLEKKDFARKVLHLSVKDFIVKLAYPDTHNLPMFPRTKELSDVIVSLMRDLSRFSLFRDVLGKLVSEKILNENWPLRFSFGQLHEVYVYANCETFPPTNDALQIFDRGVLDANSGRIPAGQLDMKKIVHMTKTWLQQNKYENFASIATGLQNIFDRRKAPGRTIFPIALKELLESVYEEGMNSKIRN